MEKKYGGIDYYFCSPWECENTRDIWYKAPMKDVLIWVTQIKNLGDRKGSSCGQGHKKSRNPILIQFT